MGISKIWYPKLFSEIWKRKRPGQGFLDYVAMLWFDDVPLLGQLADSLCVCRVTTDTMLFRMWGRLGKLYYIWQIWANLGAAGECTCALNFWGYICTYIYIYTYMLS